MALKSLVFGLAALGTVAVAPLEAREMNFAVITPTESHYGAGARAFAEKISELSGGDITINVKYGGVLGGEREVLEGMQIGTIELAISSTGPVGGFIPEIYALDFPFLFKDYAHARQILDGEIGEELLAKFEPQGLIGLAWAENGFRHVTNSVHPVRTPADLKGLKLRTMENQVHIDAFRQLGASPTPMSWTEVLTSLQQGTIDGQENPIPILVANKIWDVQKYATLTGHVYSPAIIAMSAIHWEGLSDEEKGWFREAAKAAVAADRAVVDKNDAEGVKLMMDNGMEIVTEIDKAAFAAIVEPTYEKYGAEYGEAVIKRIQEMQAD